ncbi:MAG: metallophosphoesterase [Theionarchaea archaeon]|nr:metallophosphoesterase [Theionarchaea archaeon]
MNIVLSDFHIGHPQSLISSPHGESLLHRFTAEIKELGDVEHLILLGDIFDFWDESLNSSIAHSHRFFEKMSEITDEIIYVPGNHDHHILILCETMEDIGMMERGSIPDRPFRDILKYEFPHTSPKYIETPFFKAFRPPTIPFHIRLYYPEYSMTWKGKTVLFRHGHYLDSGLFQFMPWIYEHLGGKIENERDFEIINTPIYEHLYYIGPVKEVNEFYKRVNGWVRSFRKKIYKTHVHKTIENRKKDIERFFERFKKKYPDILIFGHTHVADKGILHDMELYNSGCWIHEPSIPHSGTYIVIEDTIEIRKVGEGALFSSQ